MASWKPQEFNINNVNGGVPFENGQGVDVDAINKAIEGSAWAIEQSKAQFGYTIRTINAEPSATGYLDGSSITPVGGTKEGDFLLYGNRKLYRVSYAQFAPDGTLAMATADFIFEFKEYASMDDVREYLGSLRVTVEQLDMKATDHETRITALESGGGSSGGTQLYVHTVSVGGPTLYIVNNCPHKYKKAEDLVSAINTPVYGGPIHDENGVEIDGSAFWTRVAITVDRANTIAVTSTVYGANGIKIIEKHLNSEGVIADFEYATDYFSDSVTQL